MLYDLTSVAHELKFWSKFVHTQQFQTWLSPEPTPELDADVVQFIREKLRPDSRVLDVGAGVVSVLNGLVPQENLIATDPLAELYKCIFDYEQARMKPCIDISGEELMEEDVYDIVHVRNALDHAQNPVKVLQKMITACKPYGYIIVQGFENEADAEQHEGFHQYNISLSGQWLTFNGSRYITDVKVISAITKQLPNGKNWIVWIAQKN